MSRQVRVGILVFAGLALFLVALFAIGSRSFLFSNTFPLKAQFENIAGLQSGAPVQYQGASAGRVEEVIFPDELGQPFTVEMAIQHKVRPVITEQTVAQIKSQSLVGGNQMIVLVNPKQAQQAGAAPGQVEPVEPGATIPGQEPFNIYEISDQALAAVDTFASVAVEMRQIMQDVQRGRGSLGRFIYDDALYNRSVATIEQAEATAAETQQLMSNLSASAERITSTAEEATAGFQEVLGKVNRGEGTLGLLLNDESAYNRFLAAADTLAVSTRRIEDILANAENATQWASLGAYRFSENMEALKHNFLFKPYFEERGYMEKADFEIRESAIEATYEDLEAWQRELNEREARLDELEARLEAMGDGPGEAPPAESTPSGSTAAPGETSQAAPVEQLPAKPSPAEEGASGSTGTAPAEEPSAEATEEGAASASALAVPKRLPTLAPHENH